MLRTRLLVAVLALSIMAACAEGGGGGVGGGSDAGRDAGDAALGGDAGRRDGGTTTCPAGQHACGGGCIDDLPNEPENGCRLGCGEPCPAPATGTASCSSAGTCDFTCTVPFRREGDDCVCTPRTCESIGAMCGAPDDGCGNTLDCGNCGGEACIDGRCVCTPDPGEPGNDSRSSSPNLGSFADGDDPPDHEYGEGAIGREGDVDWVRYRILDTYDVPIGSNPDLLVTLDRVPADSTYTLSAFYVCDSGGDSTSCAQGSADNEIGRGCTRTGITSAGAVRLETECSGSDESGTLYVRVRAETWSGTCEAHRLTLRVR